MKAHQKLSLSSLVFIFFLVATLEVSAQKKSTEPFSIVAMGDFPYFLPQDYARFENVIKKVNVENPVFSVFVGDIKSSSTPCTEEAYEKIRTYFQQFEKPLIYTPGDNEWTDCNKKDAGSYDPEERLEVIRKMFFSESQSFGKKKIPLTAQSSQLAYAKFVENKRWDYNDVAFGTIHIVGTNNHFLPTSKDGNQEFFERDKANMAWLNEIFAEAKKNSRLGIIIFAHADMFMPDNSKADVFERFKEEIKKLTIDFGKPVLLVNGDSHEFLIDKPIQRDNKVHSALVNFTRLQVFGENEMHAVKITINPNSAGLFSIEQLIVEENK